MEDFRGIQTIIFDLGGVIINLEFSRTFRALAGFAGISEEALKNILKEQEILEKFDTGELTDKDIRALTRDQLNPQLTDEEINYAWNALLLDIPPERIQKIKALQGRYRLLMLSNTTNLHFEKVEAILQRDTGEKDLPSYFDRTYLSYQLGMRKPSENIYRYLLGQENIRPEETVFLDDTPANLETARNLGINTLHVSEQKPMIDLLQNV